MMHLWGCGSLRGIVLITEVNQKIGPCVYVGSFNADCSHHHGEYPRGFLTIHNGGAYNKERTDYAMDTN